MPRQVILPFLIYSFITSITPGPANLCSLSTAPHYGKATALRQWRGIATGFFLDAMAAVLVNRLLGSLLGGAALQRFFVKYQKTVDIIMAISLALCAVNLVIPHG